VTAMKRIVEDSAKKEGLDSLLGEKVILLCGNYFYAGKLVGVNKTQVALEDASIVYETGSWTDKTWKDAQSLGTGEHYVRIQWIESYRLGK
jgi:hypothetical protein